MIGRTIRRFRIKVAGADLIELGPGTGYFIDHWKHLGIGSLVEIERDLPAALSHLFGRMDRQCHIEIVQADAIHLTAPDMPGEVDVASILAGRGQEDARAADPAGAGFEVVAIDVEAHGFLLQVVASIVTRVGPR